MGLGLATASGTDIVVNDHTLSEPIGLPARSSTPVDPPFIVAVYEVEPDNGIFDVNVAVVPNGNDTIPNTGLPELSFNVNALVLELLPLH